jgi:hypothetical protein
MTFMVYLLSTFDAGGCIDASQTGTSEYRAAGFCYTKFHAKQIEFRDRNGVYHQGQDGSPRAPWRMAAESRRAQARNASDVRKSKATLAFCVA